MKVELVDYSIICRSQVAIKLYLVNKWIDTHGHWVVVVNLKLNLTGKTKIAAVHISMFLPNTNTCHMKQICITRRIKVTC